MTVPGRFPTVAELQSVGVRLRFDVGYGVLECLRCGACWQTMERPGIPLPPGYWRCPHGCNAGDDA